MKIHHLLLSISVLFFISCNKSKPNLSLPPATDTGANTLGFIANGTAYETSGPLIFESSIGVIFGGDSLSGTMSILAMGENYPEDAWQMSFNLAYNDTAGTYPLTNSGISALRFAFFSDNNSKDNYTTTSIQTGTITITHHQNNILSGTFQFNAIDSSSGKVIHVTDGRFDIAFQ